MIQITPHMRIFVATEPIDFRKGIDGIAGICRKMLKDPFSGQILFFVIVLKLQSKYYFTMGKDFGFVKSNCQKVVLNGGRKKRFKF